MPLPFPIIPNKKFQIKSKTILRVLVFLLLGLSVSCSFPGLSPSLFPNAQPAATASPSLPTIVPESIPPVLSESDPSIGSLLSLDKPITLYFNQPMQRESVESAISGDAALTSGISWSDDSTLVLSPQGSLAADSEINISISAEALAANGQTLREPISLNYHTVGYLNLAQFLPEPDAEEVDPSSAIVASFNQPVTALGAEKDEVEAAFTVSSSSNPKVKGQGEWLNTSTYIFYPDPALQGGKRYTVSLNPKIESASGSVLESALGWSFTTAAPQLLSALPENETTSVRLDSPVVLGFNQAMEANSVQAGFQLLDANQKPVEGNFTWDETGKVMTYTTSSLLDRNQTYTMLLSEEVLAQGGSPLGVSLESHFQTVPALSITESNPKQGGEKSVYEAITINFSAPIPNEDEIKKYLTITPNLPNQSIWVNTDQFSISINGDYQPESKYVVNISPDLSDIWGEKIIRSYSLELRTAAIPPTINVAPFSEVFLTPQDTSLAINATNLTSVNLTSGSLPMADFFTMMGDTGYDFRQAYSSADQKTWSQSFDSPRNASQWVDVNITPDQKPLNPGLYYLRMESGTSIDSTLPYILAVSNIHLTFKLSATDVLVWAMDLRTNTPLAGANIAIYDDTQKTLVSGQTDENGVFQGSVPDLQSLYSTYFAIAGNPGEDGFGIALSNWDTGASGWDFDIDTNYAPPRLESYIYTDRPIYRPGQTVNFRTILRQAFNGRYSIPDLTATEGQLPVTIFGELGQELDKLNLAASGIGTAYGEYTLPSDAVPGYYRIACDLATETDVTFQVANYRKPEINLEVNVTEDQALSGSSIKADISARYFFDAPADNTAVHWALYSTTDTIYLPGYQVGVEDTSWLSATNYPFMDFGLGNLESEGDAQTDANGRLTIQLPTEKSKITRKYTLEATITDESGLPVSTRDSITLHPAEFYIGVHPDSWVGKAGEQLGFAIQTVDWEKAPSGPHELLAVFQKVVWIENEGVTDEFGGTSYVAQYTPAGSVNFKTDSQGMARLAFTPPEAGVYQLDVSGEDAQTSIYLWVGGSAQAVWPALPNQRIHLVADKESYKPGETAKVFIPNPFASAATALVTLERSIVMSRQIVTIEPGGITLDFSLSGEDAPNVYVSATLIGVDAQNKPDFRQGYVALFVTPEEQRLSVSISGDPQKAGPGEDVQFNIQVKDNLGNPVQGEFSLAVVDQAVLSLADPNSEDILSAYYGNQPLGVRTGIGLSNYAQRHMLLAGGLGGGGDGSEALSVARENFPDTAFWSANIVTSADGSAQVNVTLPDNLTTWQVDLRGLTADTRVGEAQTQIITSKDLLLRPALQRFFVRGDHVRLSTVVQNNTAAELSAEVTVKAEGIVLDDPALATQKTSIPANGRAVVEWWGEVQGVDSVSLTFSTQAGEYQDSVVVQNGAIPVLAFTAPQTFSTSGALDQAVDQLELVSLPRNITNTAENGGLRLELSTSLAGMIGEALDVLEYYPYECTEQIVSRFLPNLESYLTFQELNMESPELQSRLERTLEEGVSLIASRQNEDGGWAWWQGGESDPYITSYVLVGLKRAQSAGFSVNENKIQKGVEYLMATLAAPYMLGEPYLLDRLAFEHYALALAGAGNQSGVQELFTVRDNLDPWAKAYLALALEALSSGNPQTKTLLSDLESTAIRTATGTHWEGTHADRHNMQSTVAASAIVLYALAQEQPKSPLVSEATRFLSFHRGMDGAWDSTFSSAWSVMALSQVMRRTGELRGDFSYSALLNGTPVASGATSQDNLFTPITAETSLENLYANSPNALTIRRSEGLGVLYYRADLQVFRPVEDVTAVNQGIYLERVYHAADVACRATDCRNILEIPNGERVIVRLNLTLPNDAYYLVLEDYIPAGAEILDTSLKTSQMGATGNEIYYDPQNPFENGWGWWFFSQPLIYDDHIAWAVDYLPAGSYELTYTLVALQPGEYRVLPARAWEFYFPEVQGTSAGEVFKIK